MSDSLLDALNNPTSRGVESVCKFSRIRQILTDEEKEALDKAVNGIREDAGLGKAKMYSTTWLTKVLRNFGHDVSVSTVQRHVNKECSCERIGQ
jgi:hypothetical protein